MTVGRRDASNGVAGVLVRLWAALLVTVGAAPQEDAAGFLPLFNGKDLAGWVNVNGAPETWTARDEMIVTTGHPMGVLRTDKMYENYVLELDWRHRKEGGNSGLFLHSGALPVRGSCFTKAFEVQIYLGDDPKGLYTRHGDVFAIQGSTFVPDRPHPGGWMRCLPSENRVKGAGEWNHYRVTSKDGTIKLEVNGREVSGGTKCNPRKGYLCLESEGSECHFRNLRIKELPSSSPAEDEIAEKDEGFKAIYTGSLAGWKPQAVDAWKVKDWILVGDAGATLATEKSYEDYEVILDWRPTSENFPGMMRISPRSNVEIHLNPPGKIGEWIRTRIRVEGRTYRMNQGGDLQKEGSMSPSAVRGPFVLYPLRELEIANVYVKELQ